MIEVKDILIFLEGKSNDDSKSRIEEWVRLSEFNQDEVNMFSELNKGASNLRKYFDIDAEMEFILFEKEVINSEIPTSRMASKQVEKKNQSKDVRKNSAVLPFLYSLVALAVVSYAIWFMWPQSPIIEVVEIESDAQFLLEDGSVIMLSKGGSFRSPKTFKFSSERRTYTRGEAKYIVDSGIKKEFIVETDIAGIKVTGSEFVVISNPGRTDVSVEDGRVHFFDLKDSTRYIDIVSGDHFAFDGKIFQNMNRLILDSIPEKIEAEIELKLPTLREVLRYLKNRYGSFVRFQSGMFEHIDSEINIEYEGKSVRQIIREMQSLGAIVNYQIRECPSCIEFIEIIPPK